MASMPLTSLLKITSKTAFDRATKHPFLEAAGKGELPKEKLSQWLAQDRLYAQAYIRFIGALLTKVVLPPCNTNSKACDAELTEQHIFDVLVEALNGIQRELQFFNEVSMEYGLDTTALTEEQTENEHMGAGFFEPHPITRAYVDLFMSASSPGVTLVEGMTVLFATEYVYLHAWKYAASLMESTSGVDGIQVSPASFSAGPERDRDGGALRRKFIPNWTNPEFEKFVKRIGDVADELSERIKGAEAIERMKGRCLGWWRQILWLEEKFWPDVQ